jgi:lysyl-tRNA synthetase class 1
MVYQPEVLRYIFAGTRPNTEFAISFDLDVLKIYEDYDRTERVAWGTDKARNENLYYKEKRIYELSQIEPGMPAVMPYQIGFRMLTTLLQTYSGDIDAVIAALGDVKPEQTGCLRRRAACAWYWVRECAPEEFKFALKTDGSKAELEGKALAAVKKLYTDVVPVTGTVDEKELGQKIFDVAKALEMQPKELFAAAYQALIGKDQGPRLASFMKIIGQEKLSDILKVYC